METTLGKLRTCNRSRNQKTQPSGERYQTCSKSNTTTAVSSNFYA